MRDDGRPGIAWGTDGVISMPEPLESTEVEVVDMEGFCFTPDGLKINVSKAEREDILAHGYGPQGVPGG